MGVTNHLPTGMILQVSPPCPPPNTALISGLTKGDKQVVTNPLIRPYLRWGCGMGWCFLIRTEASVNAWQNSNWKGDMNMAKSPMNPGLVFFGTLLKIFLISWYYGAVWEHNKGNVLFGEFFGCSGLEFFSWFHSALYIFTHNPSVSTEMAMGRPWWRPCDKYVPKRPGGDHLSDFTWRMVSYFLEV